MSLDNSAHDKPSWHPDDQLFLHSRTETRNLLIAFVVFLVWSVGTSYALGYDVPTADLPQTVWGMPRWVFWGVAVPWLAANVFTVVFCLFGMANDRLEASSDEDVA